MFYASRKAAKPQRYAKEGVEWINGINGLHEMNGSV